MYDPQKNHMNMRHSTAWTAFSVRFDLALAAALVVLLGLLPVPATAGATQVITDARLRLASGAEKQVPLPYQLAAGEFDAKGSVVRFALDMWMTEAPAAPVGVMVPKMSLSGRLRVNGQVVETCGHGPLERIRCLHQPSFFVVPASLWRAGGNQIEFDIYATPRQNNGLSPVTVGEAEQLYADAYQRVRWQRIDLLYGLTWLSTLMGMIALSVSIKMRQEKVYLYFGATCMMHAVASLNYFVVHPAMDTEWFIWLMFTTRLMAIPLGLLTYAAVFGRAQPWAVKAVITYLVLSPLVMWWTDSSRVAISLMSGIFLPIGIGLWLRSATWLKASFDALRFSTFIILALMLAGGLYDWLRLTGRTGFDGQFVAPYAFTGMLFGIGTLLIRDLALGLLTSRQAQAALERSAAERMAFEMTEHIPVGTFTLRQHPQELWRRFEFISERFLSLTGLQRSALMQDPRRFVDCIHPQDLDQWNTAVSQAREQLSHCNINIRLLVRGQWRWMNIESTPRQLPDGTILWEGVLIDETDRINSQAAQERWQEAVQKQRIEQSRTEEREQLLRDMHDGFGSQLATVRMMAEKGRIAPEQFPRYLQELSADLHLVVDIMGQPDVNLEAALLDMRHRLERRRLGEGVAAVHWQIDLPGLPTQNPRDILHILRLIQEALNNAMKHAHAQQVWISACYDADSNTLRVEVRDDGTGMPTPLKLGRGLNNMRHRAREIGGELHITDLHPGVAVTLTLHPRRASDETPAQDSEQVAVAGLGYGLHL